MEKHIKLRLKALIIDIIIIAIIWIIVFIASVFIFNKEIEYIYRYNVRMAIVMSLFLCKDCIKGQSIGKRIYGLKIISQTGENLSSIKTIIRNLFVFIAPIELFVLLLYNKRIGDMLTYSKVIVIRKSDKIMVKDILIYISFFSIVVFTYLLIAYLWINLFSILGFK